MANPALLALQNAEHRELVCTIFGLEQMLMAIAAIQPECVCTVGEADNWHPPLQIKQNILVKHIDFGLGKNIGTRVDHPLFQGFHPPNLISNMVIWRQLGDLAKRLTRLLQ